MLVCYKCGTKSIIDIGNEVECQSCGSNWPSEADYIKDRFSRDTFSVAVSTPPEQLGETLPKKFRFDGVTYFQKKRKRGDKVYWYWFSYDAKGQQYLGSKLPEIIEFEAKRVEANRGKLLAELNRLQAESVAIAKALDGDSLTSGEYEIVSSRLTGEGEKKET